MKLFIKIIIFVILIVIVSFTIFLFSEKLFAPTVDKNNEAKACYKNYCFNLYLAKSDAEKEQGLMFVSDLKDDQGMFFIFDKVGVYPFWMKNTLMPLDILWLDEGYKVVYISENNQPCKDNCDFIVPKNPAKYVLELKAGSIKKTGLLLQDGLSITY